jgi:phytoene dehydrogenase-like protein
VSTLVIGAGVDELVAAHALTRGGRRVLVLDDHGAGDGSMQPGWIAPQIVRELGLERRGLEIRCPDPWIAAPLPGGGRFELSQSMARSVEAIRALSARDAERWPEFCARMARCARMLEALYAAPPPDPLGRSAGDLAQLAGIALRAHRAGRQTIEDLLRLLPMPLADLLDDWFESDLLKGLLGSAGVMHLQRGPRAGGTALALLHRHVGCAPGVFRAPLSNAAAVLRTMPGIEIRAGAKVASIRVDAGRVLGVVLEGGEEIAATHVVSGTDPKRTLLELLQPGWLDPEFTRAVRQIRSRGAAPGIDRLAIAPSLDDLERAADEAKYGRVKAAGASGVEWQATHAELALDQFLWMRPLPALAGYRTPIGGLYLCGPSMHPGAGVPGAAGLHCARHVLRDFRT